MNKQFSFGFTLIEILIALTVFAVIATITSSSLFYAFNTRSRVNAQADKLNSLQLAVSMIQHDTSQAVERAIRGNDMRLFSVFTGQAKYFELTRDGYLNPQSLEKRSTLARIAWMCKEDNLIRRTWESLDSIDHDSYEDKILIKNISNCHFNYLNQSLQPLDEWREQAVTQNQRKEYFPKAIQVNFTLKEWGEMNLLFIIPEALYAPS